MPETIILDRLSATPADQGAPAAAERQADPEPEPKSLMTLPRQLRDERSRHLLKPAGLT